MLHILHSTFSFFINDTATTEIYTLSLHDALPICRMRPTSRTAGAGRGNGGRRARAVHRLRTRPGPGRLQHRSEEHTSELQSQSNLVCRLLLEKKNKEKRSWAYNDQQDVVERTDGG